MRKLVTEMLASDAALEVVGQARDGADALVKLEALRPDVVTLDVEMPVMDGLTALGEILRRRPTPVVMLSSLTQQGAEMTLRCLERGAVDFVGKPGGSISLNIAAVTAELVSKVKVAARARPTPPAPDHGEARVTRPAAHPALPLSGAGGASMGRPQALLIGASTGGPRALQVLLPALPAPLGVPVVIVQHMPAGFTASLAQRLDAASPLRVREAAAGDRLEPGLALIAPGGRHLEFDADRRAVLTDEPPVHGVRPCVDVTLDSLTRLFGGGLTAALLTGMGRDGARGLKALRDRGGRTLAEDESTCVVYGMPRAACELGGVERMLPLPEMAGAILDSLRRTP
jgi:two-component system chemotaxis response regulator CheB